MSHGSAAIVILPVALLVVITGSALAFAPLDLTDLLDAVGWSVGLHATIADDDRPRSS